MKTFIEVIFFLTSVLLANIIWIAIFAGVFYFKYYNTISAFLYQLEAGN